MVKVKEDLTGRKFGRLTVIRQIEDYIDAGGRHRANWLCECSCKEHNRIEVLGQSLKNGYTISCGCYRKEIMTKRNQIEKKKINNYSEKLCDEYGEYYIGYTHNGNKEFYIDADDYDKIKDYCWCDCIQNHLLRIQGRINGQAVIMHKFLGFTNYDHIDRNELNNRKYNLRPCTYQENARNRNKPKNNTSRIIGVYLCKTTQRWKASITIDEKQIHLGYFINKEDAIKARLQAEAKYFGEFAPQQHLFEQYGVEPITKQSD